jgi:DNA-binding transcriptional LysR family regulator
LEDYLEVRLFRRAGNSLFLTDAGQAFLPGLRAGFAELDGRWTRCGSTIAGGRWS